MNRNSISEAALGNIRSFVNPALIPACHRLSTVASLDADDRTAILLMAEALASLPYIDAEFSIQLNVDLNWEDCNWIGTLEVKRGRLVLHSTLCQQQGIKPELCCQWQHTALELCEYEDTVAHDPCHLWFWIDCFRRFVDCQFESTSVGQASMQLLANGLSFKLNSSPQVAQEDLQ